MNDKDRPIDERIAATAREAYNAPPATPREEMWAAIAERLGDEAEAASPADVTPLRPSSGQARPKPGFDLPGHAAWWIGIAAALLVGLGLGRLSLGGGTESPTVEGAPSTQTTVAEAPAPPAAESVTTGTADSAMTEGPESVPSSETIAAASPAGPEDTTAAAPGGATTNRPRSIAEPALAYRVATRKHLEGSESFLAVARSGLAQAEDDPEFGAWARSLLARTRLLLASPAAEEPGTRRLLQDLELMLAQIVVSVETGDPAETRIAGEGLQESDLLLRLRSAAGDDRAKQGTRQPVRSSSL